MNGKRPGCGAGPSRSNFAGKNARTLTQAANNNQRTFRSEEYRSAARNIARTALQQPSDRTCRILLAWAADWMGRAERLGAH